MHKEIAIAGALVMLVVGPIFLLCLWIIMGGLFGALIGSIITVVALIFFIWCGVTAIRDQKQQRRRARRSGGILRRLKFGRSK